MPGKQFFIVSLAVVILLSAAFAASAASSSGSGSFSGGHFSSARQSLKFEHIDVVSEDRLVFVRVKNLGEDRNVKVSAVIPELGVVVSRGPFKIESGDRLLRTIMLDDIPESASGEYTVRIVAKDSTRRVKHRTIII